MTKNFTQKVKKMILICNLKYDKPVYPYDVRVDRYNKVLGNPFFMVNETQRDFVCIQYEKWLKDKLINKDQDVINELKRICDIYRQHGVLRLFCWCHPKRCHAETIKRIVEFKVGGKNVK